jgi:hypothetical protein
MNGVIQLVGIGRPRDAEMKEKSSTTRTSVLIVPPL